MERWTDLTRSAERAHGIVTRDDLLAAGLSPRRITSWAAEGRLVRQGQGVYRLGGVPPSLDGEVLAAVRVCESETWASHSSLLGLRGIWIPTREGRVEVTRPAGLSIRRSVARVHQSTHLPPHHLTTLRGIPTLTLPRTCFDVARTTGPQALVRVIDSALLQRDCTMGSLWQVLYELGGRGRPGTRRMRAVLEELGRSYVPPESELEVVGRALLDGLGFDWQVEVADEQGYIRRLDGLHRMRRVNVELDGAQHARDPQKSLDRACDARLRRLGLEVVRLTWTDVTIDGEASRAKVEAALAVSRGVTSGAASRELRALLSRIRPKVHDVRGGWGSVGSGGWRDGSPSWLACR